MCFEKTTFKFRRDFKTTLWNLCYTRTVLMTNWWTLAYQLMINWHHFKWAANFGLKYWPLILSWIKEPRRPAEQYLISSRARLSLFPMFPLIWSNSHLNSDNPYSRRSRPSEHARRWEQKSRLCKQYINVTGFRPLLFHWEAMNSKHGKRHSRHESWDVRKKQTEKSLTWPLPHKLWPNYSEAIKSSTI